eukprot:TRINITY_DN6045_c0_g1_i2.p1 TRINITY_DN6045_c0_g1~~TRINITY_DN6045_c0_g1_i2.p1  ORF type:complete len:331 (-),score=97.79 TRINITY_DN6045_c0_g1_i2:72-1064(-)
MGNSSTCASQTEGLIEDTTQESEVQQLWQQDASALKDEADKRRARREQEAAARQARIEAAQQAADEAMGAATTTPEPAATKAGVAAPKAAEAKKEEPAQDAPKGEAKKEEVKVSVKSKAKKEEPKADDRKEVVNATNEQVDSKTATEKDALPPTAKQEEVKSSAKSKAEPASAPKAEPAAPTNEKEAALQKQVDEAVAITKDPDLVKYNLDVKISGARDLTPIDADPYAMCATKGKTALRFKTKTSSQRTAPVWNQAGKVQVMQGDALSFCVFGQENPGPNDWIAKAELEFDQVVPSGFEGELALEEKDSAVFDKAFIKVRVRVNSAVAA